MKAMIVSARQEFYHRCESYFHSSYTPVQLSSYNEPEITQRLETSQPEILLIDTSLGEEKAVNVFSLVKNASLAVVPGIFVRMDERKIASEARFLNLGAMYVFDAGIGDLYMVSCIHKVYKLHRRQGSEERFNEHLGRMMRKCCLLTKHMGYRCIFDGVNEVYRDPSLAHPLTDKLYKRIAHLQGTQPVRVEKNIRDAIRNAWNNGGSDIMPEYLNCSPDKPPTNSTFIMNLCERMREYMYEEDAADSESAG